LSLLDNHCESQQPSAHIETPICDRNLPNLVIIRTPSIAAFGARFDECRRAAIDVFSLDVPIRDGEGPMPFYNFIATSRY
jgi:hypothetical protein